MTIETTYIGTPYILSPTDQTGRRIPDYFNQGIQIPKKPFKLGFMLGRFQHPHIGHEMVINHAASVCDKLIVLIGSSQESGTIRNPYDYNTRLDVFKQIYGNTSNIIISSIQDLTHENDHSHDWGRYVLQRVAFVANECGIKINPDLMIFGDDEERNSWFDPEDVKHVSRLVISRGFIDVSATKMRQHLINNNFWMWRQFANEKIHGSFDVLRKDLLKIDEYKEMLTNVTE